MRSTLRVARCRRTTTLIGLRLAITVGLTAAPGMIAFGQADTRCNTQIQYYKSLPLNTSSAARAAARTAMTDCVTSADEGQRKIVLGSLGPVGSRLAEAFFGIPEYHDEGRLPAGNDANGPYLGPMAAIYASPFLDGFNRPAQISEQGKPGTLAAIVVVSRIAGETIPVTYQKLFLQDGVNCIWLTVLNPQMPVKYEAYVSHGSPCLDNATMSGPLTVKTVHNANFARHADYPPVARFDVDASGKQPVLAFKCLDSFCEVLPPLTTPRAPWISGGANVDERRVRAIKGWHDEQELGYRDANSIWRPSGARATITPDPMAARYDAVDFSGAGKHVATITIHGALPTTNTYYKWGLRTGANEVVLRNIGASWETIITPPAALGSPRRWSNTVRMLHRDAAVPPTARFRWTLIDDGIWVPCGNACCRSDGGGAQ